jgi:formyl-CoA transferase
MSFNAKPLAGLKVIELGTLIAGPFASRICAEFGAEVIKVESPDGGDPLRKWRKLYEGTSLWWFVQARNKKSLTLNLKHPDGLAILKQLLADADILIENFRPGVLEKLGLGWETLHALNPKLVMVRLSGFGQTGPMKDQPGLVRWASPWAGCATSPVSRTARRCAPGSPSATRSPPVGVIGA